MHVPKDESDPVGVLEPALHAVLATEKVENKLRKLTREGKLSELTNRERLSEALAAGFISKDEYQAVERARKLKRDVIMVDDFDKTLTSHDDKMLQRVVF
jgi:acyl-CoA dehydrogenase